MGDACERDHPPRGLRRVPRSGNAVITHPTMGEGHLLFDALDDEA